MVEIKNSAKGAAITAYENTPERGFINVVETKLIVQGRFGLKRKTRNALISGEIADLQEFVGSSDNGKLPGRIARFECVENAVPAYYTPKFKEDANPAEAMEAFVVKNAKTAGKDGVFCTCKGMRILRFAEYDPTGEMVDVRVMHDNSTQIIAAKAQVLSESAVL